MFGLLVYKSEGGTIFHLVWTYNIKAVDGRKKAQCVCDRSTRSGQVLVLAETYANCVEQTCACLFYAVASAGNLLIFSADDLNAFQRPSHLNSCSLSVWMRHFAKMVDRAS